MDANRIVYILICSVLCEGRYFIDPPSGFNGCINRSVDLTWYIHDMNNVTTIIWAKTTPTSQDIMRFTSFFGIQNVQIDPQYSRRVEYISNGSFTLKNAVWSDEGTYSCSVTFENYLPIEDIAMLTLYDLVTTNMSCELRNEEAHCSLGHQNISWTSKPSENGEVCMPEGLSNCRASDVVRCITLDDVSSPTYTTQNVTVGHNGSNGTNADENSNTVIFVIVPVLCVFLFFTLVIGIYRCRHKFISKQGSLENKTV